MSDKIKIIIKKIFDELMKLKNYKNYSDLEKVLQGNSVDKLKEFDKSISEQLKIFRIKKYDPLNRKHQEIETDLRFKKLESIIAEENAEIKSKINELINKLRIESLNENFMFFDSPFEIFKNNYSQLKKSYLKNKIDLDEADFIKYELEKRLNKEENRFLLNEKDEKVNYHFLVNNNDSINKSESKKVKFLKSKLKNLGWVTKLNESGYIFEEIKFLEENNNGNISNSDIEKPKKHKEEKYPKDVFISYEGYLSFKRCVDFLGLVEETGELKRGFSASCNAILENPTFKKEIFKSSIKLTSYIAFLIEEYGLSSKTTKLTIPNNYVDDVKKFIEIEQEKRKSLN